MNNIIKSGFPRILCRLVLAILLVGMSQFEAGAVSSRFKQIGLLDVGSEKIMPLKKSAVRKAAARSGSGIAGTLMCNEVSEDSYTGYAGIYVAEDYAWFWNKPDNITYEEDQTVLNYSSNNTYFYFRNYNDAPVLEAIKIHLDPTKTNNASVRAVFADFESGSLYYSDTQIVADYANNIIYWKPDTKYDQDNIFFYIESGELNVIGFDIYSEGNTPSDFLSGSTVTTVASPVFRPVACSFTTPISIEILAEGGCDIYYRTDGYSPTVDEQYKYNGPIVISSTTTFKAIAADSNGNTSRIVTSKYTCTRHGIGEGYDPASPGNPGTGSGETQEKTYKLTVVTNPSGAGSAYANSYNLKAGAQTYVYTYNNTGFDFLNWTIEGEEVSTSTSFYYVMPEYDVTIVANYSYNPLSPGNPSPEEQKVKHLVVVRAIPSGAASLSPSGAFDMEENASRQIYAYPNSGWHLTGWTINGEQLQSTTSPINITMGEKALDIVAYFSYNPSSPSNPGANYYNPTTGQVIIDDFTPGYLYDALSNLVGYSNFSNISGLIVKGEVTSNDLGNLSYFSNAGTIDISRTGGVSTLPGYTFSSVGASSIVLPSTISSLGNYVFRYCENLASLTIYAQEPPTCNSYTFSGFTNKANCTVYVPASAIELYSNANYWKDFTILPITPDAHVLQVNLPADASDGRYKNNSLEIVNINSGVRQKYVISDRLLYTFNGLQKDEQYNIYLFSQAGLEIGRIENVTIPDNDIEVTFGNLKKLYTVFAKVTTPDGKDVTSDVTVEWLKPLADGTTTYLRKATSLGEIPEGQALICHVTLNNQLGTVYAIPEDTEFTVNNEQNTCTVNLVPFRSIALSGMVVDGDGTALSGASVSVNQTLNGKYSKSYTAKTDRQGKWTLSVLDAPETRLTFAATECVNVNDTIGAFEPEISTLDLGKATMKSIVGARITYGFTYHAAGSEDVQDYYSDYQNVLVSVFNVTQNRAHNDVSLQYPILAVLDENINTDDELRLIATSKTGAFNPIVETVTVGENQRAEVTFDIVGKGGIAAAFEMTDNPAVIAMLYSAKGELLKKQTYSEAQTTFTELEDGEYTLVSMGQSDLMNSILRLSNFSEIGLTEGKDYVKNAVRVESGKLSEVANAEIPAFDESLFYYTTSASYFSSNKSSITSGDYLTLRSAIDFKNVYKSDISNVELIIDLPDNCEFVDKSVLQGPNQISYTLNLNRLTIPLNNNYLSQVKFCVIPTNQGTLNISGAVSFSYKDKIIIQPIGNVNAEVKSLEIQVPENIAKPDFFVKGYGEQDSKVTVMDNNGNVLGTGRVGRDGFWSVNCTLQNPINLNGYEIFAILETSDGIKVTTETKRIAYNIMNVTPIKVIGVSDDVTEGEIKFDFVDTPTGAYYYTIVASDGGSITFLVYLTDNSPDKIKNMILYNHRVDGNVDMLYPKYDANKDCWFATMDLNMENVPVNVSLDYDVAVESKGDLSETRFNTNDAISEFAELSSGILLIDDYFKDTDTPTIETIDNLYTALGLPIRDNTAAGFPSDISMWSDEQIESYVDNILTELEDEEISTECDNLINSLLVEDSSHASIIFDEGTKLSVGTCDGFTIEDLISTGFVQLPVIDDSNVFYKIENLSVEIVDFGNNRYLRVEGVEIENTSINLRKAKGVNPVLGALYAVITKLFDAKGALEALAGSESTPVEIMLNRTATILNTITSELHSAEAEIDKLLQMPLKKAAELEAKFTAKVLQARLAIMEIKSPIIRSILNDRLKAVERQQVLAKLAAKGIKFSITVIKKSIPILNWITLIGDLGHKVVDLKSAYEAIPTKGCKEEDLAIIEGYRSEGKNIAQELIFYGIVGAATNIVTDMEIVGGAVGSVATAGGSLVVSVIGIATKVIANIAAIVVEDGVNNRIVRFKDEVSKIKFDCPEDDPENPTNPKKPNDPKKPHGEYVSNTPDAQVHIDPAGYVYEAVPGNRIEGVQATIYYKETKEDMYGDPYEEIILWNAEEYAQQNPLFTDENGMYRWDVPQGLWQVKFEKDGYVTAYSEWLPVPPPQLEVNIGIVQNKQPEVTEARAYEEGVEVQFDKFMDLSTLTTDNIYVTANGEKLNGSIRLIDSALADEYADEEDESATRYASRVRFVPEETLSATTGEIRVTVSRNVLSYAGIPMTETFSQVLDVEKEVQIITADDVKVLYGGEKEVTIYALPYEAAVGRTLRIANSSELITSVDKTEATIDEEGKATVIVKGDLPGRAQLTFSIDDVTVTGECAVDVVTEIINAEAPKSSRASGTAVYRGTKVELTTESKDGVIYFTTDGSCPCDENGTRRKYTVPIIINEDTRILAMTSVGNGDDDVSETVEFNYTLKRSDMDFAMDEGWTWISHNFESPIAAETLAADENVQRIMSQTQEVIRDPQLGMVGMLQELNASESYKVETSATTARQRLSEIAWNPGTPIALNSGWNWLGYPVSQTMSVDEAFAPTAAENLDVIVGQNGFAQFDGESWVGTLETLSPGLGYMYQSQSPKNVVYNTSIVSSAQARYAAGISQNSPLVLDIHKYASIMPVVATIKGVDGMNLDNEDYQVNAFCGTECRGIGRVVKGLVMMNVYGNANDKITFQVTDNDGEVQFANNSSLSFSEQIVGNLNDPYAISINSQSGISNVTYDGNIKVSIVGDMLVIKGIAADDINLVEVYDIDGQKLIHETRVSESGIRISHLNTGVYIVIVNGNGEYTYHKIALR